MLSCLLHFQDFSQKVLKYINFQNVKKKDPRINGIFQIV